MPRAADIESRYYDTGAEYGSLCGVHHWHKYYVVVQAQGYFCPHHPRY